MGTIKIAGKLYISTFENILNQHYRKSLKDRNIVFDLRHLEWIGLYPASLFFSWVMHLNNVKGIDSIEIQLPERKQLPPQVSKILLQNNLLSIINNGKKMILPYYSGSSSYDGIELTMPESYGNIAQILNYQAEGYIQRMNLMGASAKSVKNIFEIILFELVENIFIHADGACPHYALSHSLSSGKKSYSTYGLMTVFDANIQYVEIILGDLGSGINTKLKPYYSDEKKQIIDLGKNNRKEERILTYAFDFFSTCDEEGRKARIDKLISDEVLKVKTSDIASGLFCVFQAARSNQGQFIVRTPQAILGFDFYSKPNNVHVTGRSNLGIKSLAPLPGTHYILRFPLTKRNFEESKRTIHAVQNQIEFDFNKTGAPEVVIPFSVYKNNYSASSTIDQALKAINEHLNFYRNIEGITLIMPPIIPLIAREISIFIVGLNSLYNGKRILIWCNPIVFSFFTNEFIERSSILSQAFILGGTYISDIILNKFALFEISEIEKSNKQLLNNFSVTTKVLNIIQASYISSLESILVRILKQKKILHEPGPFLIEGKYYTEKFYEISKTLKDAEERRRVAEWCFYQCKEIPEILLVTANSLKLLSNELIGMMGQNGKAPEIIIFSEYKDASKVLSYKNKGKKGIIIADVICRGKTVQDLLLWAFLLEIERIITIVDARDSLKIQQDFYHISVGKQKKFIPVNSIVKDSIEIFNKPIKAERIFVIDKKTVSPTLHVRPSNTKISLFEMLNGPAKEANALFSAHCEYKEKHYAYFLHLPKLTRTLSKQIKVWVKNHVDHIEKQSHGDKSDKNIIYDEWRVLLCNTEIKWIETFLNDLLPNVKIDHITKEKLLAPDIPFNDDNRREDIEASGILDINSKKQVDSDLKIKKRNILIIHSAIASGETARLSIEFASRKNPDNIVLLFFMARMDPYHRNFFDGIVKYRNSLISFGIFLDFPIASFPLNSRTCPMCAEIDYLDELMQLIPDFLKKDKPTIQIAIQEKISANKAIVLEYGEEKDNINKKLSDHSMYRAYYRALYEGSKYDIHMRDKLYEELIQDKESIDRFLEVVSYERLNPIFNENEIEWRLTNSQSYTVFPLLKERLYEILESEGPPFQIGRIVGALIHLIPESFVTKSINLMQRFINYYTDICEICIGLILINTLPLEIDDFLSYCRQNKHPKTEILFSETRDVISKRNKKNIDDSNNTILTITLLQHELLYSGNFSSSSETLSQIASKADKNFNMERLKAIVNRLCNGWKRDISPLISKLNRYNMWTDLKQRHTEIVNRLDELDSYVVKLSKQIEAINVQKLKDTGHQIVQEIYERGINIDSLRRSIGVSIEEELSFNFDNHFLLKFPDHIIANNGSEIKVFKEIDYDLHSVFCNENELTEIINEVIKNWKQHKKDSKDAVCSVKIYKKDNFVCLEFADNIPGDFSLDGMGGIRMTKDFCNSYGCELIHDKPNQDNVKILRILFQTPRFS